MTVSQLNERIVVKVGLILGLGLGSEMLSIFCFSRTTDSKCLC